jgi:hypothetical protein
MVYDKGFNPNSKLRQQLELDATRLQERYNIKPSKTLKGVANKFGKVLDARWKTAGKVAGKAAGRLNMIGNIQVPTRLLEEAINPAMRARGKGTRI